MPKIKSIPAFINSENKLVVLDKSSNKLAIYSAAKYKVDYIYAMSGVKFKQGVYVGDCHAPNNSSIAIMNVQSENEDVLTVVSEEPDNIVLINTDGTLYSVGNETLQSMLDKKQVNGLMLDKGSIPTKNSDKSNDYKFRVPDYLSDWVDESWNILLKDESDAPKIDDKSGKTDNEAEEISAESIALGVGNYEKKSNEQRGKSEPAIETKDSTTGLVSENSNNKVNTKEKTTKFSINDVEPNRNVNGFDITYIELYRSMVRLSRVGDIISIPAIILSSFKKEIIDIFGSNLDGTKSKRIIRIRTGEDPTDYTIGILDYEVDAKIFKFQVMNKLDDPDSLQIVDIRETYYRWKNSTRFV